MWGFPHYKGLLVTPVLISSPVDPREQKLLKSLFLETPCTLRKFGQNTENRDPSI